MSDAGFDVEADGAVVERRIESRYDGAAAYRERLLSAWGSMLHTFPSLDDREAFLADVAEAATTRNGGTVVFENILVDITAPVR